ncbi:MAG: hypothetical protein GX847_06200 [Clostridiales bacterium]|nr:hypothetical protein [Clostridiales bacterium]
MSSFSDTIETDTNVLYASTPVLILTDYLDERVIDKGSYEIDYDTLEETGVITIICKFDKPESGPPLNGIPQIVTLVIDGTEYISTSSRGDGSGDRYTKTYGIKMPVGDTLEDGYTLIGSGYQSLTLPHAFEIDLSTYAS